MKKAVRRVLFQLHWALGITAGCVLVVISFTGVLLSFEDEITAAASAGIVSVATPPGARPLSPDALLERVREQRPGRRIVSLTLATAPGASARVLFDRDGSGERRSYLDPYDGRLLGPARGEGFFGTVRRLHRWLLLPHDGDGWGRRITGITALSLVYFALSGLWLRWPRRPLEWRQWFAIDRHLHGRAFVRTLHATVGTWLAVFYLSSGLTGLWWSYDWYRAGVTAALASAAGSSGTAAGNGGGPRTGERLAAALAAVTADGAYRDVSFTLSGAADPVRVRALPLGARHARAYDDLVLSPNGKTIVARDRYAERPTGRAMTGAWLSLHTGAFFGLAGRIAILLSTATLPLFAVTGWLLYLKRRRLDLARRGIARNTAEMKSA